MPMPFASPEMLSPDRLDEAIDERRLEIRAGGGVDPPAEDEAVGLGVENACSHARALRGPRPLRARVRRGAAPPRRSARFPWRTFPAGLPRRSTAVGGKARWPDAASCGRRVSFWRSGRGGPRMSETAALRQGGVFSHAPEGFARQLSGWGGGGGGGEREAGGGGEGGGGLRTRRPRWRVRTHGQGGGARRMSRPPFAASRVEWHERIQDRRSCAHRP